MKKRIIKNKIKELKVGIRVRMLSKKMYMALTLNLKHIIREVICIVAERSIAGMFGRRTINDLGIASHRCYTPNAFIYTNLK